MCISQLSSKALVKQAFLFDQVAWIALTPEGVSFYTKEGRTALVTRLKELYPAQTFVFDTQLPLEVNASLGQQRLKQELKEPQYYSYQEKDGEHIWQGIVPVDLFYFKDHFSTFPLVPGVVQLRWIKEKAISLYPDLPAPVNIHNLKFTKAIRPHTHLELKIKWNAAKKALAFTLLSEQEVCCKGSFIY